MSLSKRSAAADRGFLTGGSLLSRSHGSRSSSCSTMQKQLGNKQYRQAPLAPLSPSQRSTPDLSPTSTVERELPCSPPTAPSSPIGKRISPSTKYLVPLPPKDAPSRLLQEHEVTALALSLPQSRSQKLSATVDMSEFQPKYKSKLQVSKKGVLDLTRRLCMSIPRPLPAPRQAKMSTSLLRLHSWQQQINPRVPRPSGMLLRLARLREAVLKNHSEMQKNRSSLQALRESFNSSGRDSQAPALLALDNVVSDRPTSPRSEVDQGGLTITCKIDTPLVAQLA